MATLIASSGPVRTVAIVKGKFATLRHKAAIRVENHFLWFRLVDFAMLYGIYSQM